MSLWQDEMKEKAKLEEEKKDEEKEDPKGIPEFWLTVFKNVDLLSDMLQVAGRGRGRGGGSRIGSDDVDVEGKTEVCLHLVAAGTSRTEFEVEGSFVVIPAICDVHGAPKRALFSGPLCKDGVQCTVEKK